MKRKLFTIIIVFSFTIIYAQTSSDGEIELYSRESSKSSIGYYTSSFEMPAEFNGERFSFSGVAYSHNYDMANLGNISIGNDDEIRFKLEGTFRIGASIGDKNIDSTMNLYPTNNLKYYGISIDAFSLTVQSQYTHIFDDGYALNVEFGIGLINIGGDGYMLDGGNLLEHSVGIIKVIPLVFKPSVFFDFGRSGIGIGCYINPVDIFNILISSSNLYKGQRGVKTTSAFHKRFEFQIIFTF